MTFKHKLSVRLALLKDLLPVVPVVALLAACEQPSLVGPPIKTNINVSKIVTVPDSPSEVKTSLLVGSNQVESTPAPTGTL